MRTCCVVLAVVLGAFALSACSGGTTTPNQATDQVSSRHTVNGVADLYGIACPTATKCVAVGANALNGQGIVVPITNGTPGALHVVTGTKSLLSVSCSGPNTCQAVGVGGGHGVLVTITGGMPGAEQTATDTSTLQTVSCSGASTCVAGGRSLATGSVVTDPTTVRTIVGTTSVNGIACPGSQCTAVASTSNGKYNDVLLPVDQGAPGTYVVVPPGTSTFAGIACTAPGSCVAVGRGVHNAKGRNSPEAVVLDVNGGKPGHLAGVPSSTADLLQAVACAPGGECEAVGTGGPIAASGAPTGKGVFLRVTGGQPGPVQVAPGSPVSLNGIACPSAGSCVAVGSEASTAVVMRLALS